MIRYLSTFFLNSIQVPPKPPANPFWSRMKSVSKKQQALAIAVLILMLIALIVVIAVPAYFCCCRRGKERLVRRRGAKRRGAGARGGAYHILYNSEGEEPLANGDNSLF